MLGNVTRSEISEQFQLWASLVQDMDLLKSDVDSLFKVREYDDVVFIGAGSSYHLATSAAATFQAVTGESAFAVPSSEIAFFHRYHLKKERKYIAVFFSRSGMTTETLEALNVVKTNYRAATVAISCSPASSLCKQTDISFPVKNCIEQSCIMTKSFTGMLFVSYMFAAAYGEKYTNITYLEELGNEGRSSLEWQRRVIDEIALKCPMDRTTVLGGGPMYGLAAECALKLDEVALLRTKVYSPLELRHGPHAAIGSGDFVILFHSNSAAAQELSLAAEMKTRGAKVLIITEKSGPEIENVADYRLLAGRGIPEHCRGILYVPFIQLLACQAANNRDIDPDNVPGLTRVITL